MSDSIAFDRAVGYYDATRGFDLEREMKVVDGLAAALGQLDGRVLEIGIGSGRIAIPLQQRGYEYYGIDLSMLMMRKLRENAEVRSKYSFPLAQGDITRLPFKDGTFAAIIAVHVFHLIPRWREALAECRRVLGTGGAIIHAGSRPTTESDAAARVTQKWRELLDAAGYTDKSTSSHRLAAQINEALTAMGAKAVETIATAAWSNQHSPHQSYDHIASRQWSSTWAVPDDLFAPTIAQLYDWTAQEYGDGFDTPQESGQEFFITRAVF
jgi:ubiquinone/menaquinone biosynthesis C-methylase UbiE